MGLAEEIRADVDLLEEFFGGDEFGDVQKTWKRHHKVLNAIPGVLDCDAGFFEAIAKPIAHDEKWGIQLMKMVEKKRKSKDRKDKERGKEMFDDDESDSEVETQQKSNI